MTEGKCPVLSRVTLSKEYKPYWKFYKIQKKLPDFKLKLIK